MVVFEEILDLLSFEFKVEISFGDLLIVCQLDIVKELHHEASWHSLSLTNF